MNVGLHGKIKKIEYDVIREVRFSENNYYVSKYKKYRLFWQITI